MPMSYIYIHNAAPGHLLSATGGSAAGETVLFGGAGRDVARGPRTFLIVTLEYLGVSITCKREKR